MNVVGVGTKMGSVIINKYKTAISGHLGAPFHVTSILGLMSWFVESASHHVLFYDQIRFKVEIPRRCVSTPDI